MLDALGTLPLLGILALGAVVILLAGLRLTRLADQIADRTGFGEAMVGGVLLGAATSMSGTVVSVTAALDGRASLAFSNGVGGIAAQTAFLALADLFYRRANLEHAAADLSNIVQGVMLALLLSVPIAAWTLPEIAVWGVHPASVVLVLAYVAGVRLSQSARTDPMWHPEPTRDTHEDTPDEDDAQAAKDGGARGPVTAFLLLVALMATAGWVLSQAASVLTDRYGLSASLVGALLTAVLTSLPELVTTLAAIRRNALQLAVGGIIGGNTFDTLFLTMSDVAYRDGSLYHAIGPEDRLWAVTGLLMTVVLLLGLVMRQRQGAAGIGFESLLIFGIYGGAIAAAAALF